MDYLSIPEKLEQIRLEPESEAIRETLMEILKTLTPKEEITVKRRCGIGGEPQTFKKIGEEFSLTASRMGQVYEKAIRKTKTRLKIRMSHLGDVSTEYIIRLLKNQC